METLDSGPRLSLENSGLSKGDALVFNLLGEGLRKETNKPEDKWKSTACNLKSAGYRYITKKNSDGVEVEFLQFGFQLFDPLTHWQYCELNVQFDKDGDGLAAFELAGMSAETVPGITAASFASYLLDAGIARGIRLAFEDKIRLGLPVSTPNYAPSVMSVAEMLLYEPSTIAAMEVEVSKLGIAERSVAIKVAVLHGDTSNNMEADDFLSDAWSTLTLDSNAQAYKGMPLVTELVAGATASLNLTRGTGTEALVLYFPNNVSGSDSLILHQ